MFKDMDYKDIVYWDRVEGATGAIDKLTVTDDVEVSGDSYELEDDEPQQTQGLFKEPAEIFNIVYKNVINKTIKQLLFLTGQNTFLCKWTFWRRKTKHYFIRKSIKR